MFFMSKYKVSAPQEKLSEQEVIMLNNYSSLKSTMPICEIRHIEAVIGKPRANTLCPRYYRAWIKEAAKITKLAARTR